MRFEVRRPAPPLADWINLLWYYEGAGMEHGLERVLPGGMLQIVIDLGDGPLDLFSAKGDRQRFRGALINGAHADYFVIDRSRAARLIGIHFRPGGAFPFLAMPVDAFRECHAGLDDVWGRALSAELRERLFELADPAACFDFLESFLINQAAVPNRRRRNGMVDFALEQLSRPGALPGIGELADDLGYSSRHFIATFKKEVGLAPRDFGRIQRFQRALARIYREKRPNWSDLALACGYYDQAHFNHEFRAFSGLKPSEYAGRTGEHSSHVSHD